MARINLLTLLLISTYWVSPAFSGESSAAWCRHTPWKETCERFVSSNPKYHVPINEKSEFFKLCANIAFDHSVEAQRGLHGADRTRLSKREQVAWEDCIELYESTVEHIGKSLDQKLNPTATDAQTWLSTALTNIETCKDGLLEAESNGNSFPISLEDGRNLLSNALAVNEGSHYEETSASHDQEFPSWVSKGDRKLLQSPNPAADIVVAQDGSGNYRTVNEGVAAAAKRAGSKRLVIYVKQGTYNEYVNIGSGLTNIMMVGDGIGKTIITGSRSVGGGSSTFNSATFAVVGAGFIGKGISFRNTAPLSNHQAVAVRSGSDRSVFYLCSIEGNQDTIYVYSNRQFYRQCNIYGTVDFIFGNAAAVFQNCNIYARRPLSNTNTITAQGRTDPNQNTGISIQNCVVSQATDLSGVRTYLGRPWKQYSRTVFLESTLGGLIDPAGWLAWDGNFALNTLYYGEYSNNGAGSSTANRVKWKGYHVITSSSEAAQFTVANFIGGNSWLPGTGVPYNGGL